MNTIFVDPDIKVNMALDDIIQLSRNELNSQILRRRNGRKKKKKRTNCDSDHSVPLLSSPGGVGIYVTKTSSLLTADHWRRMSQALSNRALNSELIEKTKEIIPAEYKLVRTNQGVERVLVPSKQYFSKPSGKHLLPPRKLNKQSVKVNSVADKPPPLMSLTVLNPQIESMKMDVDEENDIAVLDSPEKEFEVIDVESNLPLSVLEGKFYLPSLIPNKSLKTLNERFTMLTGNFKF